MITPGPTWPPAVAADYRRHGYWRGRTLGAALRASAAEHPGRTAVVSGADRLTYAELDTRCDRLADGLAGLGIRAHDRVVVQLPNDAEFAELFFALVRLGAVPVLVMPSYRRQELEALMAVAEPVALVIPDVSAGFDHRPQAMALRAAVPSLRHVVVVGEPGQGIPFSELRGEAHELPDRDPEDVALCVMSGGTTGAPKLVPRTHENYAYLENVCAASGIGRDDVYLAALPLAHNFPLSCPGLLGTLVTGGTTVMSPTPSPDDAFGLIARERVTWTTLVPSLAELWAHTAAEAPTDLSSFRLVQVGGAVFRPEAARAVALGLGCRLQQVYGMAEGLLTLTALDDPEDLVVSTQGRPPCPGDELRLVDEDGVDVEPGGVGELWTRGPYTVRGYAGAPAQSALAFTSDGYYRTGDLVRLLPSGHLMVTGRSKDVINRGGDKVPCEELEGHLLAHPAVAAAAVVPVPDPVLGERTCAFLVPQDEAPSLRGVRVFLGQRGVAGFKFPDRLEIMDHLPLTKIGKIDRKVLAALAAGTGDG